MIKALSIVRSYVMKSVYATLFLLVAVVGVISLSAALWYSLVAALFGMATVALGALSIWLYKRIFDADEPVEPGTTH